MENATAMFSNGAAYERLMGRWSQKVGHGFLDWFAAAPGQDWLDVGCGNGAFTEVIAARSLCASLSGIDPAEGQIAYARQRPATEDVAYQLGDAQALPFADASFDVSVMALVIAFVPDPARAVRELARVTRPAGLSGTYMWDKRPGGLPLTPLFRELAAMGYNVPNPLETGASSRETLHQLWQDAGFHDVQTTSLQITVAFDDFEDFWHSSTLPAGPQSATLKALSDTERDTLRAQLRASLPTDAKGQIAYSATANAVKGKRK